MSSDPNVAHSRKGPSSGERWINCTASVAFCADAEDTTSVYAAEGTAAHTLSEWAREEGKPCKHWLGTKIEVDGYTFEVDTEMVTNVQRFVDYCEQWPGDAFFEERVHYTAWVEDGWGTGDDLRIDEPVCRVTDLKYGKGLKVYAKNNIQLLLYALGAYQDYGHLYDIKEFVLAIHQPRLDHVDEWAITVKELLTWARDVVCVAEAQIQSGETEFKPGSWCKFCPKKLECEARTETMQAEYLEDLDTEPGLLPNYKLGEVMDKLPEIKQWIADIEKRALSEVQKGNSVAGAAGEYKLVAGRGSRSWKDPAKAEKALRSVRKLKVADILPPKLVSPAQAEKLIGKDHVIIADHVKKSPGKPVLVAGSDPRPPLQVDAEDEFSDLDNAD